MVTSELYVGDCVNIMANCVPDASVHLVVTSPPYDSLRDYHGGSWDVKAVSEQLERILVPGGVVVWVVADATVDGSETGTSFQHTFAFKGAGFLLHDTMIWNKGIFTFPPINRYPNVFEYMFVFSKGTPRVFNGIRDRRNKRFGEKVHGTNRLKDGTTRPKLNTGNLIGEFGLRHNVWDIPPEMALSRTWKHPAMFPERLVHDHVLSWSNVGDTVFDPFMGSGTVGKVAKELDRHFIGCDISAEYVEMARKRIAGAKNSESFAAESFAAASI